MEPITALLAINGVLIVGMSSAAGFPLYRALLHDKNPHDWHLLHAGGTARGVFLIALAGTIHLARLREGQAALAAGLIMLFVWASTIAMLLRAITGEPGFSLSGSPPNRLGFMLYAVGVVSLFSGLAWLGWGFLKAI